MKEDTVAGAVRGWLEAQLPESFFHTQVLGLWSWQWVGLALLALLAFIVAWVVTALVAPVARFLVRRTTNAYDDKLLEVSIAPARLLAALGVFATGTAALHLTGPTYELLAMVERTLGVGILIWLVVRVIDVASRVLTDHLTESDRPSAVAVMPLARRAAKAFLVVLGVIVGLQNAGFHVTGLIAGLGVGGIAVALAAQKTIENLFGGVTLVTDQPVRVGDFCRFGSDKSGTVEQIGLRSTRVRTLDRTVVSVPNSQFAEIQIENFGPRERIRLYTVLGLRYETTSDQLRQVLVELRKLLLRHPRVVNDGARVRLIGFGAHSLDVELLAFVETTEFAEFVAIREDLFLAIIDLIEEAGSGFAFPSQTLYLGRDGGLDPERRRVAEEQIRSLRAEGRLPFPDFDAETRAGLDGSGRYPPEGSVG